MAQPRARRTSRRGALAGRLVLVVGLCGVLAVVVPGPAGAASSHGPGVVLHVSPRGSGAECSEGRPCSLTGAQQAVRALLRRDGGGPVTVRVADGTYRLDAPLRFTAADSGTPGAPVTWEAAPGAHPRVSGGVRVTGWTESDPAKGIWAAKVPAGTRTRQVFIDGSSVPVAQASVGSLGLALTDWGAGGFTTSGTTATWFSDLAAGIGASGVAGLQFAWVPAPPTDWEESECPVAAVGPGTIAMAQPCWRNLTAKAPTIWGGNSSNITPYSLNPGTAPTTIENAYPLLHPGQWYLDQGTDTLYYMPSAGQRMSGLDVEVPTLQSLAQVTGTLANPVHDLAFTGLTFTTATWLQPSTDVGFAQVQANLSVTGDANQGECAFAAGAPGTCPWGAFSRPAAAVQLTAADRVTFAGDTFTDLGGVGLGAEYGSDDNLIEGDTFTQISSSAVWLGCSGDPDPTDARTDPPSAVIADCASDPASAHDSIGANEIMTGNTVTENVIHHVATDYLGAVGIMLLFTQHTTVSHNDVFDLPYDAISSGAWEGHPDTDLANQNITTNIDADNAIVDNLFHDNMQRFGDGGDIYTEGHQGITAYHADGSIDRAASFANGTLISGNVSDTDTPYYSYAVAPDAGSQWLSVTGNVEWNSHYAMSSHWPEASDPWTRSYGNWYADPDDTPPNSGQYDNTTIPETPGPSDVPLDVLAGAGVQGGYQALEAAVAPSLYYSGFSPATATAPARVLVAGTGFTRRTQVSIGGVTSAHVRYLSSGFLVADVPPCVADTAPVALGPGPAPALGLVASTGYVQAGQSFTVRATLCNPTSGPFTGTSVSLAAPSGWTVAPAGPAPLGTVAPHADAQASFTVTAAASGLAGGSLQQVTGTAAFTEPGRPGTRQVTGTAQVQVPYASVAAAFDNVGVSDDTDTAAADIDADGSSFSAQALASVGVTPGRALTFDGVAFTWPGAAAGRQDNVIATGQSVDLPGSGGVLGLLDTSVGGPSRGTGTITYSDGSTQAFTLSVADWYGSAPSGSNAVIVPPYRNRPGNTQDHTAVNVYEQSIPLEAGKTVAVVTLPDAGPDTPTTSSLHVFAMALATPTE